MNHISTAKIVGFYCGCFCIAVSIALAFFVSSLETKSDFVSSLETKSEDWTSVASNYAGQYLYDKQSIKKHPDGTVTVIAKHIISFEWHKMIATREIAGAYYATYLDTLDCNKWQYAQLRMTYKTVEGRVLYDTVNDTGGLKKIVYHDISPGSPTEKIAMEVCAKDGKLPPAYYDSKMAKPVKPKDPWSNPVLWDKLVVYPPQTKTQASFPVRIHKELPEFTFTIHGEFNNTMEFYPLSVEITDSSTQKPIQTLGGKGRFDDTVCEGHDINTLFFADLVQFVDLNHDGYLDFRILCGTGATGMNWYATYLYKPKLKKLCYHWMLSHLPAVTPDPDSKGMKTYVRVGSCDECREYFTITNDDRLVLTKVEWTEEDRDELDNRVCHKVTGTPYEKTKMYLNRSSLCVDLMVTENFQKNIRKKVKVINDERLRGSLDGRARGPLGNPMSKEGG
ncbi:MAG TPA: hypothetical protein PK344_15065 [Syntrophorhabdaceae bacterium]|nr:hypothetical protein [Syntrophorhabdaceae bacterium]